MCIIAYAKKGVIIPDECIEDMFIANPDGAGVMVKSNNHITIKKGFFDIADLLEYWHKLPLNSERAIHCRIATSGYIDKNNSHPFQFPGGSIMHNGIINAFTPSKNSKVSDTYLFTKKFISPLSRYLDSQQVQQAIKDLTIGSRLLIFRENAKTLFFGKWHNIKKYPGVKFSNTVFDSYYYSSYQYFEDDYLSSCKYVLVSSVEPVNKNKLANWCKSRDITLIGVYPNNDHTTGLELMGNIPYNLDTIGGYQVVDVY